MKLPRFGPYRPSPFGERFFTYSPKLRELLAFPSKLEYEYHLLIEIDAAVETYRPQPCEARAFVDGKWRLSIPDFWVKWATGECAYVEVKYESELRNPEARAHRQIAIQRAWCAENQDEHRIVTDTLIWQNPILICSLRTLFYHFSKRQYEGSLDSIERLLPTALQLVYERPNTSVSDAEAMAPSGARSDIWRLAILELIRRGKLEAELATKQFTPASRLNVRRVAL